VVLLTGVSIIRASNYYANRIHWTWLVREASWRTARDAEAQLSRIGPGSHVYMESGDVVPWLFVPGGGLYLQLLRHDYSIQCILHKSGAELRALYDRDGAEKYLVDYAPDGSLTTRLACPRREAPAVAR
jgi:hypothetical protein